jgi:hypothetical protein
MGEAEAGIPAMTEDRRRVSSAQIISTKSGASMLDAVKMEVRDTM